MVGRSGTRSIYESLSWRCPCGGNVKNCAAGRCQSSQQSARHTPVPLATCCSRGDWCTIPCPAAIASSPTHPPSCCPVAWTWITQRRLRLYQVRSPDEITWYDYLIILPDDITWWYYLMILPDDITCIKSETLGVSGWACTAFAYAARAACADVRTGARISLNFLDLPALRRSRTDSCVICW